MRSTTWKGRTRSRSSLLNDTLIHEVSYLKGANTVTTKLIKRYAYLWSGLMGLTIKRYAYSCGQLPKKGEGTRSRSSLLNDTLIHEVNYLKGANTVTIKLIKRCAYLWSGRMGLTVKRYAYS